MRLDYWIEQQRYAPSRSAVVIQALIDHLDAEGVPVAEKLTTDKDGKPVKK